MRCMAIVSLPYVVKMQENDVNASRIAFPAEVAARLSGLYFHKIYIKQTFISDHFKLTLSKMPARKM